MRISTLSERLTGALLAFAWDEWAQMGVLAAAPRRSPWVQDPEALLLITLQVGRDDPRLFDEVLDWMSRNERLLSARRLRMLAKHPADRRLADAAVTSAGRWRQHTALQPHLPPAAGPLEPLFRSGGLTALRPDPIFEAFGFLRPPADPSGKSREPDLTTAINFAFRLRQFLGVGTRAEAVRYLFTAEVEDASASEAAVSSGFAKRNVQEALASLHAAGVVKLSTDAGEQRYSLDRVRWAYLLNLDPDQLPVWRNWPPLFSALREIHRWLLRPGLEDLSEYLLASQAADLLDEVRPQLNRAGLLLPARRGGTESWSDLVETVELALYWLALPADASSRPAAFEILEDRDGGHRWRLTAPSGRIVATSAESYPSRGSARRAARRLQENPARYTVRAAADAGAYRWAIVAENGRVLAVSGEAYATEYDATRAARDARDLVVNAAAPTETVLSPSDRRGHVAQRPDGRWAVRSEDGTRTASLHTSKRDAVRAAREQARDTWGSGEVVVHGRDGQIVDADSVAPRP